MKAHALSLEPLTLPDVQGRGLVDIAARTGFDYVSMVLHEPVPVLPVDPIVSDEVLRRETAAAMKASGVRLLNIECFNMTSEVRVEDFARGLECGHELGARTATAIVLDNPERSDVLTKYRRLCDMAAEFGIRVNIEFLALTPNMRSLGAAVALVRDSGRDNAGVTIDVLHLFRTGSTLADLKALDPALIGGVQLSDGPLLVNEGRKTQESVRNRGVPGSGEFPLREFLAAVPDSMVIGVEVPQVKLIGSVSPEDRARALITATRRLYET